MTSILKPLKFLSEHYNSLQKLYQENFNIKKEEEEVE